MARNNRTADRVQAMLNMIGGDEILDALMSGQAVLTVEFLKVGSAQAEGGSVDLLAFFKTRKGLRVSNTFSRLILSKLKKREVSVVGSVVNCQILREFSDVSMIIDILPEDYNFEELETSLHSLTFCLQNQWRGEGGAFALTDGSVNILLVEVEDQVLGVTVRWTEKQFWHCDAYDLRKAVFEPGAKIIWITN